MQNLKPGKVLAECAVSGQSGWRRAPVLEYPRQTRRGKMQYRGMRDAFTPRGNWHDEA